MKLPLGGGSFPWGGSKRLPLSVSASPLTESLEPTYQQLQKMKLDKSPFVVVSVVGQELLTAGHHGASVVVLEAALKIGTCSLKLRGSVFSALSSAYWSLGNSEKSTGYMQQDLDVAKTLGSPRLPPDSLGVPGEHRPGGPSSEKRPPCPRRPLQLGWKGNWGGGGAGPQGSPDWGRASSQASRARWPRLPPALQVLVESSALNNCGFGMRLEAGEQAMGPILLGGGAGKLEKETLAGCGWTGSWVAPQEGIGLPPELCFLEEPKSHVGKQRHCGC